MKENRVRLRNPSEPDVAVRPAKEGRLSDVNGLAGERVAKANQVMPIHDDSGSVIGLDPFFSSVRVIQPRNKHYANGRSNQFSKRITCYK
ncbi:hypothetical protein E2C01_079452 [Portunus trituberculatus]|uniref:Uncharacterized protein n=1 Tax=Portunus trituberculatus TaxID=210409 RepID=A0A5B7IQD1_PORTR|nr:hypothetical protein [Portunus trituberculatus]